MYSQYLFNELLLNPAYCGSRISTNATLLHRNQWVAFEGAPKTSLLSFDHPLMEKNMGLGLIVANDKIGVTKQTDIYTNYSYHIRFRYSNLSFGLKTGISNYNAALTTLTVWDNDKVFAADRNSFIIPKFGFGTYYYSEKFFVGFSIPELMAYDKNKNFSYDINKSSNIRKHYFLHSGYSHKISSSLKLKPTFLLKYLPKSPLQADLNINFIYKEIYLLGGSYRTGDALVAIIQFQIVKNLKLGYAFDYTLSKLNHYTYGSHEIMLGYDFGKNYINVNTPSMF